MRALALRLCHCSITSIVGVCAGSVTSIACVCRGSITCMVGFLCSGSITCIVGVLCRGSVTDTVGVCALIGLQALLPCLYSRLLGAVGIGRFRALTWGA